MKKLLITLALFFASYLPAQATTYYVRQDGGAASQCSGLVDAPYLGSGTGPDCALGHPNWVLAPIGNNPTKMVGGDTMIIDGTGGAQYRMGYGTPNSSDTTKCYTAWPYDCNLRAIPSGPSAAQPTRILGKGFDTGCASAPQLWGQERLGYILSLNGSSNVELQCLELTDHSPCIEFGPSGNACKRDAYPFGPWAGRGIVASDSTNVLLNFVNIHGLQTGIHAGRLKDWTIKNSNIDKHGWAGWNGDIGANISSNSGTITFDNTSIKFNGCGETYPGGEPVTCWSQSQGGYGDGLGTHKTGGKWVFKNVNISNNTSDGIDLLYHDGNGDVLIENSTIKNNAGNQVKTASKTVMNNVDVDGDCSFFKGKPYTSIYANNGALQGFDHCRAAGNALSFAFPAGATIDMDHVTVKNATGDCIILSGGGACNGTEYIKATKSKFSAGTEYWSGEQVCFSWAGGSDGNGTGTCGALKTSGTDYSVWNVKSACPTGATCIAPELAPADWGYQDVILPPACVPDGSCSAAFPLCGTTTGVDNCGNECTKTGPACCVPDGSCNAPTPACEATTVGTDNCGNPCAKTGEACPVLPIVNNITMSQFTRKPKLYTDKIQAGEKVYINNYYSNNYEVIER